MQNCQAGEQIGTLDATTREKLGADWLVSAPVRASDGHHGQTNGRGDGADNLLVADPISAHEGKTYTHEGKNNFRLHNVVAFGSKEHAQDAGDLAPTLRAAENDNGGTPPAIAFDWQQPGDARYRPVRAGDYTGALSETRVDAVSYSAGVRRLTPRECNRLQGFPDDWDRYGADGKEITDSHRYRCMGNAVCVPVAEWLGHRLVAVDAYQR